MAAKAADGGCPMTAKEPAAKGLSRGVWIAPWVGPEDEMVLFAIDARRHLVATHTSPKLSDHFAALDALWHQLDTVDPAFGATASSLVPPVVSKLRRPPTRERVAIGSLKLVLGGPR
jgi:hypothetical protein